MKRCTAAGSSDNRIPEARRVTFIVRMWCDGDRPARDGWRGMVEHAQSGERRAVSGADALLDLLTAWLKEEAE